MKVEEYLSSYDKLLNEISVLIEEDKYTDVMGLVSEIDHLIALIEKEVSLLPPSDKAKLKPKAEAIVKKQEAILAKIDEKVKGLQSNIDMIPKLQRAAKVYGKNEQI